MTDNRTPRTCGSCQYRIEGECRCCPPQIVVIKLTHGFHTEAEYPEVSEDFPGCSLWHHNKRSGIQP